MMNNILNEDEVKLFIEDEVKRQLSAKTREVINRDVEEYIKTRTQYAYTDYYIKHLIEESVMDRVEKLMPKLDLEYLDGVYEKIAKDLSYKVRDIFVEHLVNCLNPTDEIDEDEEGEN